MWDIFSIYYTKQAQKNHYPFNTSDSIRVLSQSLHTPMDFYGSRSGIACQFLGTSNFLSPEDFFCIKRMISTISYL